MLFEEETDRWATAWNESGDIYESRYSVMGEVNQIFGNPILKNRYRLPIKGQGVYNLVKKSRNECVFFNGNTHETNERVCLCVRV